MNLALDHLELAEEFYQAFRDLPAQGPRGIPVSWPRYFAFCHAIELSLKAYLLACGVGETELRAPGVRHNLDVLLEKAVTAGLSVGALCQSELQLLHQAHSRFWPRYPKTSGEPLFLIETFEPYLIELLCRVSDALRGPDQRLYVKY